MSSSILPGSAGKVYKGTCQMCHGGCGILVTVQKGKIVKVTGDKDCPTNQGWLCVKGRNSQSFQYNPHRLKYPLKRVGKRGENKWQRITWDEATTIIADKLKTIRDESGPEAIAISTGTKFSDTGFLASLFALHLGTPNLCGSGMAQCFLPRMEVSKDTYGRFYFPDFEGNPECIVMWGDRSDITCHNFYNPARLKRALEKADKLIVVDPRRVPLAEKASTWLPVRPGTDAALALSMLNVIITENLFEKEFVQKWTNASFLVRRDTNELLVESELVPGGAEDRYLVWDTESQSIRPYDVPGIEGSLSCDKIIDGIPVRTVWDIFVERVKEYPPEKAARITWVPAAKIQEAARIYATVKPAALLWGVPMDMEVNSHQTLRAISLLKVVTGNLDNPGGNVHMPPIRGWEKMMLGSTRPPETLKMIPDAVWEKQLGTDVYRLLKKTATAHIPTLMNAVLEGKPYSVRALVTLGANPLICWADSKKTYETLKKVEFSVAFELLMTPTAQLADIVLPAATFFEKDRISQQPSGAGIAMMVPKLVQPLEECRDEFEVVGEILGKSNLAHNWPWASAREFFAEQLSLIGTTWKEAEEKICLMSPVDYRKHETDYYRQGGGFATPTGKIAIYSSKWRKAGYDPLPRFDEPPETPYSRPDLAEEYPLIMISGRIPHYFHSQYREVAAIRKYRPDPIVQIHPETAAGLGLREGEWVWIESLRGRCRQKVELFDGIDKQVIHTEHNWWFPEKEGSEPSLYGAFESNVNVLTSSEDSLLDPGFGSCNLRNILCRVYPAQA